MEIWVHRNGQYAGRFSEAAIREKVADGSLSASDLAWDEAKSAWKPISEFLAALPSEKSEAAPPVEAEAKPVPARVTTPPPLPSTTMSAAGPPPLPAMPSSTTPAAQPSAHQPPEGETIWSPYVAIFGSILLTPAFGGFLVWRNWLRMNRRRRAMVAAPWFWLGFVIIVLLFYSRERIVWVIWAVYLVAWIAFSAYPQIRYVHTTWKLERMKSGLPLVAAFILSVAGFATYWLTSPEIKTTPTLQPSTQQPTTTQISQPSPPPPHDQVFSADELRDMYK